MHETKRSVINSKRCLSRPVNCTEATDKARKYKIAALIDF